MLCLSTVMILDLRDNKIARYVIRIHFFRKKYSIRDFRSELFLDRLPSEITTMTALERLDLSNNNLSE